MSWHDLYCSYDDDALTVLANTGLLRRAVKDLESGRVVWIGQGESGGAIAVDGQRVDLDSRGIRHARCDCPAAGICRHILAAVLWIRHQSALHDSDSPEVPASAEPLTTPFSEKKQDALADLLSLDPELVFKQAGKAVVRRAMAWIRENPVATVTEQGSILLISPSSPGFDCRYVAGAGLDGMVSEAPEFRRKAVHLAAVLLVWRLHDKPFQIPAGFDAEVSEQGKGLTEGELRFLGQVRAIIEELVANGLSHVSTVTSGRLQALTMSARGEGFPRLAAMLRNLGGTVYLLARRDFRADEHQALDHLAGIYALCTAMARPDADLAALRGSRIRDYQALEDTEVLPLGGYWWENRSGARGLTLLFWDPSRRGLLRTTQARPDNSDGSFTAGTLWSLRPVWSQGGSPEQLCRGAVRLTEARLSDDYQLAAGGDTRAFPGDPWPMTEPRLDELGEDDWSSLGRLLRGALGLASYRIDHLVLRPSRVERPILNEVMQTQEWTIVDRNGRGLVLRSAYDRGKAKRIVNLEHLVTRNADIRAVTVRADAGRQGIVFEPLTVLVAESGVVRAVSLDFADESPKKESPLMPRILRMLAAKRVSPPPVAQPGLASRVLETVLDIVGMMADTGRHELTEIQRETLLQRESLACAVGLELPAGLIRDLLDAPSISPAQLVRLHYVGRRCLDLDCYSPTDDA
jgi:hypothetical protein